MYNGNCKWLTYSEWKTMSVESGNKNEIFGENNFVVVTSLNRDTYLGYSTLLKNTTLDNLFNTQIVQQYFGQEILSAYGGV